MTTRTLPTLVVLALAMMPLVFADSGGVIVQEQHGVYRVTARFTVPQAPDAVLGVLTDYERIPRYVPNVTMSVVRSRVPGRAIVEQEAQGRVMMFSKRVHLLLDIREGADSLVFVDTSGKSFESYQGTWKVVANGTVTQVIYELHAKPAFEVPQFVLMRLFRKDATQMIERLQAEIASPGVHRVEE